MIRVRFAPSPTGYLHVGGARTALFNYLYARAQGGQFLLRIEDTDRERSTPEFEKEILESLRWLGLGWDEEIVYQSRRLSVYREAADQLLSRGLAYEQDREGKKAVLFKMPARRVVVHDLVHGETAFDSALFEDLVILKSDGYPTYHFACVVDDHAMEITHVIRGDDHVSNTPRHLLLFDALGWKPPKYAHVPLILGTDGTPLSKRHGAVALSSFRREGYVPEGLANYLLLLGWGQEGNQEFYRIEDAIKKFTLKGINKSGARFNWEKLAWLNAQHLRSLPEGEYLRRITEFYPEEPGRLGPETWRRLALLYRDRIKTFGDLAREAAYVFEEVENYDAELLGRYVGTASLAGHLKHWAGRAELVPDFGDPAPVEELTRAAARECGIEAKDIIHPLRFALTGKTVSPGLFDLMSVIGKEVCLKRVRNLLARCPGAGGA